MFLEALKIWAGRICFRTWILPRIVPTSRRFLMPVDLGAKLGRARVAAKDVVFVNVNTRLQRFE